MRRLIRVFDQTINASIKKLPRGLRPVMKFFTVIGQPPITMGIPTVAYFYGLANEQRFYQVAGLIALTAIIFTSLLKLYLRRARPSNDYVKKMLIQTYSFPSGHASGSLISFGLLAIIITSYWPAAGVVAWISMLLLIFFIGLSRVYLGAHYTSDVVGGWLIGAVGLVSIIFMN